MFIGSHDRTVYFDCGVGLKDWLPTDDAWKEHATWFPLCVHVNYIKGPTFIRDCRNLRMTNRQRMRMVNNEDE